MLKQVSVSIYYVKKAIDEMSDEDLEREINTRREKKWLVRRPRQIKVKTCQKTKIILVHFVVNIRMISKL